MSKKLEITSNFADRLADAVRQFGGRTIERAAGVSTGTVCLITGGKQTLIGEAVLERLSLALEDLWDKRGESVARTGDPATCRRDTPAQADGAGEEEEEGVIDDEPIADQNVWDALESTYAAGYQVGALRGQIDGMIALIRAVAGHDDTVSRACGIISLTADRLAEMAVPE